MGRILLLACFAVAVVISAKFSGFWGSTCRETVFYEVKAHVPGAVVARDLERLGVISSESWFRWYGRLSGNSRRIKAGDYRFEAGMRPSQVMAVLVSGISYGVLLTIPEGYTMAQAAQLVEQQHPGGAERFLRACKDAGFIRTLGLEPPPATLEGYLFPDTYSILRHMGEEEMIRAMVRRYREVFTPEVAARARALGLSPHQAVTLASIIEKETGAKEERPLISSVFHNRMRKGMRLQSDPTVIYGIPGFDGNITRRDLDTPTPYNTYVIKGLPPGPIANPGREAILAAVAPAESRYLYFVSHNDGTHEFTETYEAHKKAVAKFQLDPKAREGKSWRDLNRRVQR